MNPEQPYDRVAQAEQALKNAGYQRNASAAMWIDGAGKRAKVVRGDNGKFYITAK